MQLTRLRVLVMLVLAVTSSSLLVWHFTSATPSPSIGRVVTPGNMGPCTWFISLDGTTPVAEAMVGGLSVSVGDNLVGTAGEDIVTFLNTFVAANQNDCWGPGTFTTSNNFNWKNGLSFYGSGIGVTVWSFTTSNPAVNIVTVPNGDNNIVISGMSFIGTLSPASNSLEWSMGNVANITFSNFYLKGAGFQVLLSTDANTATTLTATNDAKHVYFTNAIFDGTGMFSTSPNMVSSLGHDIKFLYCQWINMPMSSGVILYGLHRTDIDGPMEVAHSYFKGNAGGNGAVLVEDMVGADVGNNIFIDSGSAAGPAILIAQNLDFASSAGSNVNTNIHDNTIEMNTQSQGAIGVSSRVIGSTTATVATGLSITNNIAKEFFTTVGSSDLQSFFTPSGITAGVTVSGNTALGNWVDGLYNTADMQNGLVVNNRFNVSNYLVNLNTLPSNRMYILNNIGTGAGGSSINFASGTNLWTQNNFAFNPRPVFAVTAGGSPFSRTDNDGYLEQIQITTLNGMTGWTCQGQTMINAVNQLSSLLEPGEACTFTWATTAPVFEVLPQ